MFILEITDTDGSAFEDVNEIPRILAEVGEKIKQGVTESSIFDLNGNRVGFWKGGVKESLPANTIKVGDICWYGFNQNFHLYEDEEDLLADFDGSMCEVVGFTEDGNVEISFDIIDGSEGVAFTVDATELEVYYEKP